MSGEIETPAKLKTEFLAELQLMRPVDWEAYWKEVPWPKPNLIELAKIGTSPLAAALNRLAPEILTELAQRAACVSEAVRNPLFRGDPSRHCLPPAPFLCRPSDQGLPPCNEA